MHTVNRRASFVAAIAAATIAAVVGCSQGNAPSSAGTTTTVQPASAPSLPSATSAAPQSPASQTPVKAKPVDVTVAPEGDTTVRLGGPPLRFTVTLVNNGPDLPQVGLVVSLGHCSCGPPGASMMAEGSMRMLDAQTNEWVNVPYVREGTGMDYITQNLVPPFPLSHGQTVTYQLEMQLNAHQDFDVTDGETSIGATLTDPDNPMAGNRLGRGSYHPIIVEV
jgi:hypothetical protein